MSASHAPFDSQLEDRLRVISEADEEAGALTARDYGALCIVTLVVPAVLLLAVALS